MVGKARLRAFDDEKHISNRNKIWCRGWWKGERQNILQQHPLIFYNKSIFVLGSAETKCIYFFIDPGSLCSIS